VKLARFGNDRIGMVRDDIIVDVTEMAGGTPGEWPPVAMTRLIANYAELKRKLEQAARGKGVPLASVRLLTPVPWPSKVIAYPVNYHDHGAEMHVGYRADNQGFFLKPPSSLSGPADPIVLPINAGRRIDPPPSVHSASGNSPAAQPAAEPPLDPPGVRRGSQGLRVTPNSGFAV